MILDQNESRHLCEKLLGMTSAGDARASVTSEDYSQSRFAANDFTTNGRRENVSASLTVWIDQKRGSASANNLDDASLRAAAEEAEQLARLAPVDREYVPTLGAMKYRPTRGYAESTGNISLTRRARDINGIIVACDKAGVIGAGFHHATASAAASATRNGNFHYERSSLASLSATARTRDGGSSGYFLRNHFDAARLDASRVGREAIQKALTSREPRALAAGVYPVILQPQAAVDLIHGFGFDARSADEGRSAYSLPGGETRVGRKIFDERINIYSDPWHPELPGSSAALDGIPSEKVFYVRQGVLEKLHYNRHWARVKNQPPTPAGGPSILESTGPTSTEAQMIASMKRGLLVSRFWYIRAVDPRTLLFTGLTRDGVWLIENGKIQYPVRNFRFNQSITELLAPGNVDQIGVAERVSPSESQGNGSMLMPALKVNAFHFSSQSEAV